VIQAAWNAEGRIAQSPLRNWNDCNGPIVRNLQIARPVRIVRPIRTAQFDRIDRIASNVSRAWTIQIARIARPVRIVRRTQIDRIALNVRSVWTVQIARIVRFLRIVRIDRFVRTNPPIRTTRFDRIDRRIDQIARIGRTPLNNPNASSPIPQPSPQHGGAFFLSDRAVS
jgi:hypothetical protein